jgi:glucose/arabinose dehydrogenase
VEHGPRGGDELNRIVAGRNYGWPEITYGINYDGTIITGERVKDGMEQPNLYWRPSIAVSGLDFYSGDAFPYWRNHLLVSALRDQEVRLLSLAEDRVQHQEVILEDAGRVREAVTGPDGAIYVVLNAPSAVLRLSHMRDATARTE